MIILHMSISASVLILAIVAVRAVMLNRLPQKTFLVLWAVAFCRLTIPFNLPSKFSVFTLAGKAAQLLGAQNTSSVLRSGTLQTTIVKIGGMVGAAGRNAVSPLSIIWLIGMFCVALFLITTHLRCRRGYKMALPIDNAFITKWQQEHTTKRKIQIKQSDMITTPLTYGVLHPIVLLPRAMDYADERGLKYVLAHEYTHIKRVDILAKWLLAAGVCIHWFNPIVWVMYIFANRDIEISCDKTVVLTFGEAIKSSYAFALINLEEKKSCLNPLAVHFSKNAIEERINAIMRIKRLTALSLVLAIVAVMGTTTVFASSAIEPVTRIKPTYAAMTTDKNHSLKPHAFTADAIILNENGAIGEHDIPINGTAFYTSRADSKKLFAAGEMCTISLRIVDREFDYGQGVHIGYINSGTRTQLFDGQIKKGVNIKFTAPKDGTYSFYIECASSDPLLIEKVSIS